MQFLGCTRHISNAHKPHVARSCPAARRVSGHPVVRGGSPGRALLSEDCAGWEGEAVRLQGGGQRKQVGAWQLG